jgi:hypothetical protein
MECRRIVKSYDGHSIEISGLNVGKIQLGKFGIEPKVLQTASQALLILDASQYDLCMSIKNLTDQSIKQDYVKKMVDDKFQAQKIYRALAALSLNPQGTAMQESVRDLVSSLLGVEQRTKELEESNVLSKVQQQQGPPVPSTTTSPSSSTSTKLESPVEIGNKSFKEKIEEVKRESKATTKPTAEKVRVSGVLKDEQLDEQTRKEMDDIRKIILALNDEYMDSKIEGQLDVDEFWTRRLGRAVQELTRNRRYRKVIGSVNADILDRNIIKISGKVKEIRDAHGIEAQTRENISRNEAELYIGDIFRILDDIYLSIVPEPSAPTST